MKNPEEHRNWECGTSDEETERLTEIERLAQEVDPEVEDPVE